LIRRFNEDHRGEIRVEWREMPATSSQYFEQMQAELQSGESNVDVIAGDVTHLDGPLQTVEYEGKTWGVPWFTEAGMFFYRRDLLERAGFSEPPATWAEMKEMARKVKADLGARDGYVFQGSQDEGGVVDALEHVWNAGGDVLDGDRS
jgi:multiple sugar transport system substrate-binding protein